MSDGPQTVLVADSCAGGTAALKHLLKICPGFHYVYLCDGEMNPFGIKPQYAIIGIVRAWLRFARDIHASVLVIACNTASAAINSCRKELEEEFSTIIITMFDAAEHAFQQHHMVLHEKRVALFGTSFTVNSHVYDSLLGKYAPSEIISISGTKSESVVARNRIQSTDAIQEVKTELSVLLDESVHSIILACTCFEFLIPVILELCPNIRIVNLNEFLAVVLAQRITYSTQASHRRTIQDVKFLATGNLIEWTVNMNTIIRIAYNCIANIEGVIIR